MSSTPLRKRKPGSGVPRCGAAGSWPFTDTINSATTVVDDEHETLRFSAWRSRDVRDRAALTAIDVRHDAVVGAEADPIPADLVRVRHGHDEGVSDAGRERRHRQDQTGRWPETRRRG